MRHARSERTGFTVTELLVVIAIIATMMALLLPAVQFAREAGRRSQCANNLKQIASGFHQHNATWEHFPNAGEHWLDPRAKSASGQPKGFKEQTWGWPYQILPYLEKQDVWKDPNDEHVAGAIIKSYFCPTLRKPVALVGGKGNGLPTDIPRGAIDYAGNGGYSTPVFNDPAAQNSDGEWMGQNGTLIPRYDRDRVGIGFFKDGASATLLVGERNVDFRRTADPSQPDEDNGYIDGWDWDNIRWAYTVPIHCKVDSNMAFGSAHPAVCQFAMADGSVKALSFTIDLQTFKWLSGRSDGKSPELSR